MKVTKPRLWRSLRRPLAIGKSPINWSGTTIIRFNLFPQHAGSVELARDADNFTDWLNGKPRTPPQSAPNQEGVDGRGRIRSTVGRGPLEHGRERLRVAFR